MAQLQTTGITGSTPFPVTVVNTINNESEVKNSNLSSGNTSSADMVCFNDLGSSVSYQGTYYLDLGINSSGYTYGFIGKGNDAYLFNSGSQSSSFWIGNLDKTGSIYLWAGSSTNSGSGLKITSQSISSGVPITATTFIGTASYMSGSDPVMSSSIRFTEAAGFPRIRATSTFLFFERNDGGARKSIDVGEVAAVNATMTGNTSTANLTVTNTITAEKVSRGYFEQVLRMSQYWDFFNYTSSGAIGTANLSSNADGWLINTGSILSGSTEYNHPGCIVRRTSAILNQVNGFFPGGTLSNTYVTLGNSDEFRVIMNMMTGSLTQSVRVGFFDNMSSNPPANGIYFEKTGSVFAQRNVWMAVIRSASVQWSASTSTDCTSSNVWRNMLITGVNMGSTVDFYIDNDNTPVATWNSDSPITAPITGTLPMMFGIQAIPGTTTTLDYKIDFIRYDSTSLTR